jgi:hypothetical protein
MPVWYMISKSTQRFGREGSSACLEREREKRRRRRQWAEKVP